MGFNSVFKGLKAVQYILILYGSEKLSLLWFFLDAVTTGHILSGPFSHVIITKTNWCADSPFPSSVYWPYSILYLFVGWLCMFFRFLLRHVFHIHVSAKDGMFYKLLSSHYLYYYTAGYIVMCVTADEYYTSEIKWRHKLSASFRRVFLTAKKCLW